MKNLHQSINQFQKCVIIFSIALSISFPVSSFATGSSIRMGKIIASNDTTVSSNTTLIQDSVLAVADKMPEYPGGNEAKFKFLANNLRYPDIAKDKNQQGRVIVQFVVSKTGKVKNAKVVKSISPSLDKEALRVVNSFPKWIPGEQNGVPIDVYQLVPISFTLDDAVNNNTSWIIDDKTLIVIDSLKMPLGFNMEVLNIDRIDTGRVIKPFPLEAKNRLIEQFGPLAGNGVILIKTIKNKSIVSDTITSKPDDLNYIYNKVEKMPQFPKGESFLKTFIAINSKYPKLAIEHEIQGNVVVQLVIDRTGKVTNPIILDSADPILDNECLHVVKSFPNWIPGEKDGQKVNVRVKIPFEFRRDGFSNYLYNNLNVVKKRNLLIILDGDKLSHYFDLNWLNFDKIISYNISFPTTGKIKDQFIEKYGIEAENGIVELKSNKKSNNPIVEKEEIKDSLGNHIYQKIDKMPQFPGGETGLMNFIANNIKYPFLSMLNGVQGTVILRFKVNTDGKAENPEILKGLDPECDKEAIHLVNSLPEWVPGENGGKKVTVYYTLPIRFRIEGSGMQENLNKVLIVDGKIMPGSYDFRKAFGKDIISMTVLNPDSREIINDLVKKYGQKASSGVILITTNKNNHVAVSDSINELTKSKYKIYKASSLDKMPQFPGGLNKLDNFISSNLKLIPEEKSEKLRTVIVQFIIDGNGKVIQPLIIQGVNPVLNAEAIRVVKIIPDWIPGEVNGIKVASYYFLPITY